jgi:hypothetical protein
MTVASASGFLPRALCLAHAAEQALDALEAELKRIGDEGDRTVTF